LLQNLVFTVSDVQNNWKIEIAFEAKIASIAGDWSNEK
jgi:hypothetical protein